MSARTRCDHCGRRFKHRLTVHARTVTGQIDVVAVAREVERLLRGGDDGPKVAA